MPFSSAPLKSFLLCQTAFVAMGFILVGAWRVSEGVMGGWPMIGGASICLVVVLVLLWNVGVSGPGELPKAAKEEALLPVSALERAVWESDEAGLETLRRLLSSKEFDVNQVTSEGSSLIAYAADYAPADAVQCLLEAGALPNGSGSGELAAVSAVLSEDCLSLAWLLAFGADPLLLDSDGDSAFSLALSADMGAEMLVVMLVHLSSSLQAECLAKIECHDAILARRVASGLALLSRPKGGTSS